MTNPTTSPASASDAGGVFRNAMALIARSFRLRPFAYVAAILSASTYGIGSVALSWVLGRATDNVIEPGFLEDDLRSSTLWWTLLAFLLVGISRAAGAMGRRWFMSLAEFGTQQVWRNQLIDRYLDVPMDFHHRYPAGRLLAHADSDMESATRMLKPLAFALGTIVMTGAALLLLVFINVWLALVGVVLFPTLAILNRVYTNMVAQLAIDERQIVGEVSSVAHESFDGALVVKTLGREAAEVERLDEASLRLQNMRIRIGRRRGTFEPLLDALPNIGIVALVLVGASLVGSGDVSTGDLVSAVALFTILAVPVRIVGFFLQELPASVAALARVDGVLAEPVNTVPTAPVSLAPTGPLGVELRDVNFTYGETAVLKNVNVQIAPGESVAVVGSTGSGKSTVGHLIANLIEPKSGTVLIGDQPLTNLRRAEASTAVSIVFQEAFLFADSIRENLTLGEPWTDDEVTDALERANALAFVNDMPQGIETVVGERGVTLSGGQRQRVALARAMLRSPRVLVLDDATSAVDPTIEARILSNVRHDIATTLVVIAYRLATIRLADRVIYLADGQIVGEGPHEELMGDPNYAALIRAYEEAAAPSTPEGLGTN